MGNESLLGGNTGTAARRRQAADKVVVRVGSWEQLGTAASAVRRAVFIEEQGIPAALELDARDAVAVHAVAFDGNGTALATGRLLPDAHIGRMAVIAAHRGRGLGATILRALVAVAQGRGMAELRLHSQASAIGFYRREGFTAIGDLYEEAGIPHQTMVRQLDRGVAASPAGRGDVG